MPIQHLRSAIRRAPSRFPFCVAFRTRPFTAPRSSRPISIQAAQGPLPGPDRREPMDTPIYAQSPGTSSLEIQSPSLDSTTSLPAPPESPDFTPRHLQHPFDTHAFVSYLEKNGLDRPHARALMEAVKELIVSRGKITRYTMVGKEEMENAAYLFNAALSELRTELSVQTRNDGLSLKAMAGAIRREVEQLEQKMKEDTQTLKHDIEMDMNNRKAETRTEMKGFDIFIEEINNKFTISLGDLRTEIESVKWDATRRAISVIILIVVATIGSVTFFTVGNSPEEKAKVAVPAEPKPAAMKDMAVGTEDEFIEDVGTYTEQRLDKLLKEQGMDIEKLKKKKEGKKVKDDVFVDRI